jgi:hypothetical protein
MSLASVRTSQKSIRASRTRDDDLTHEKSHVSKLFKTVSDQYKEIKRGFFKTLVALLVSDDSQIGTVIFFLIEFLQLWAFCFLKIEWGPWGNTFGSILLYTQVSPIFHHVVII